MDLGLESGSDRDQLGAVAHQLPQFTRLRWRDPGLRQSAHPQQIGQIGSIAHVILDSSVSESFDSQRMRQMHARSASVQHVDCPVPAVRRFQHHLGVRSSQLKLQSPGDRIVDDPHRRQLLAGFGLTYDHRPLPMQIDPNELPAVILVHKGPPSVCGSNTPSIRRGRHEERRPRPFIPSSGLGGLAVCPGGVFAIEGVVA